MSIRGKNGCSAYSRLGLPDKVLQIQLLRHLIDGHRILIARRDRLLDVCVCITLCCRRCVLRLCKYATYAMDCSTRTAPAGTIDQFASGCLFEGPNWG